jgi:DNA-binding response OmpR family regulator
MSLQKVLICGDDAELLTSRGMVLAQAGFDVASACTKDEIGSISKNDTVVLGVIGHSLSEDDQLSVAENMKLRWPEIKILFLSKLPLEIQKLSVSEYRTSSSNPAHLVEVCRQIVGAS